MDIRSLKTTSSILRVRHVMQLLMVLDFRYNNL
jgi:hypothetical protein